MAILRSKIRNKYSQIPNSIIRDKYLSDGDYRLLILLYSFPNDWKINQEYLAMQVKCNLRNVNAKIKRIKDAGYLELVRNVYGENKEVGFIYYLKEKEELKTEKYTSVDDTSVDDYTSVDDTSVDDVHNNTNIINTKYIVNNNINNIKEKVKKEIYFEDEEVNELFNEFLQIRKKLKAVNSDRAIKILQNKLNNFTNKEKVEMLNNSIENSWKGIYELKEKPNEEFKRHYL